MTSERIVEALRPDAGRKAGTVLVTCRETKTSMGVTWSGGSLPGFTQFDYLLLEAPSREYLSDELLAEIRIALLRGARVVWFLSEQTHVSVAELLVGDTCRKIRPAPVGTTELLVDARPLAQPNAQVTYVFSAASPWIPLGMWESVDSTWLALRPSRSRGLEIVAPSPPTYSDETVEQIKASVEGLALKTGPISAARRAMATLVAAAFVLLVCVTIARYWQRSINLSMRETYYSNTALTLDNIHWRTDSVLEKLNPQEKNAPIESFFPTGELTSDDVVERLSFYRKMNLIGAHARLTQLIVTTGNESAREGLGFYLSSLIASLDPEYPDYLATETQLSPSKVEGARYVAQYFLNAVAALGNDSLSSRNSTAMYAARRIVDVTRDNFLWSSPSFQRRFAFRNYAEAFAKKGTVDTLLRTDYVDYARTAIVAANWPEQEAESGWIAFKTRWPKSPLSIDAEFNALRSRIASPAAADRWPSIYDDAIAFAKRHPTSPLSDDAALYAWRFAVSLADPSRIRESALLLQTRHAKSDSAAVMRTVVDVGIEQMTEMAGRFSIEQANALLLNPPDCRTAQPDETLDTLHFMALLAPRNRLAPVECGEWLTTAVSRIARSRGW